MGKHLAQKPKHELNFIKKPTRVSDRPAEGRHAAHRKEAADQSTKKEKRERSVNLSVRLQNNTRTAVLLAAAALLLVLIRFLPLEGWMIPAAYMIPFMLAFIDPAFDAFGEFRSGSWLNDSILTCLAAVILFSIRSYTDAVFLLLLYGILCLLENRLKNNILSAHAQGLDILPGHVLLVTDDGVRHVSPNAVSQGDIILVPAGDRIPLDGVITEGITTVDTAAISGQRSPWAVNVGYRVYSGCRNLTSDIKIRVTRPYTQSTARRIVDLSQNAPDFASEQELTVSRFQRIYPAALLLLSILVGFVIPLIRGGWVLHLRKAAILLIAGRNAAKACGIPLLYRKALALSAKSGVFIKGGDCIESMARCETMIFDKTGTITEGRYAVTDVTPVKMSERQLLTIAATAESFSRHPIAAAIREASGKVDDRVLKVIRIKELPGRGVSALAGGRRILVGNAALLEENGVRYNIPSRPGTAVHVAVDNRYCGYIVVADKVRRRAFDALETLRVNGIKKLVLLTGDVLSVARPIASRLNFDMLRAELRPEDKSRAVEYLVKNKGGRSTIAFVGEGENSGRIMSCADVGIAMGSLGSDIAMASADVLIMDRDIFKIPKSVALSRRIFRTAWANFFICSGIHLLIALFGALGLFSPFTALILSFAAAAAALFNTHRIR